MAMSLSLEEVEMTYPNQKVDALEANSKGSNEYEILKAHALGCRLSQFDKRALTEYLITPIRWAQVSTWRCLGCYAEN